MKITFNTTLQKGTEKNVSGISVPADVIANLNGGKKPKVIITLNGYSYRSTVAVMGNAFMIPFNQEHRLASRLNGDETLDITLELDTEPRTVDIPDDLLTALSAQAGILDKFNASSYSIRKEFVRQVLDAKTPETREKRIAKVIEKLS
ncbi:MAG: YdeI/OmpD-associated family protein [Anaerolineae bacterium]|nr:YdeI/OmpD-associated family protein [Anaerolineae bacterium]